MSAVALDTGTELSLLGFLAQNPEEFPSTLPLLKEFEFQSTVTKYLWALMEKAWTKYEAVPSLAQIRNLIYADKRNNTQTLEILDKVVTTVYSLNITGLDKMAVLARVLEFQRGKIQERFGSIDVHNFTQEVNWVRERLDTMENLAAGDRGEWGFILEDRWTLDPKATFSTYLGNPIPLGLPRTDYKLGGGIRGGELILPAGLPGDGKTMFIVSIICNFIRAKRRAYVCQLDNTFQEFMAKIWSNLLRIPISRIVDPADEEVAKDTARRMMLYKKANPGIEKLLIVRKYPRGTVTMKQIERDMMAMRRILIPYDRERGVPKEQQGAIDVWAADYLDVIADEEHTKSGSERFRFDNVCKKAAGLCESWGIPGILPSQLHRTAKFLETPDIDNLAEAFSKSWHAAIIPMFFGSRADRLLGKINLFFAKTRRAEEKFVVPLERDKLHQTFTEDLSRDVYYIDEVRKDPQTMEKRQAKLKKPEPEPEERDGELLTRIKKLRGQKSDPQKTEEDGGEAAA